MTTPSQPDPDTVAPPAADPSQPSFGWQPGRDPARVWKLLTVLFAVTTIGCAVWVFLLFQASLDDGDAAASELAAVQAERDDLAAQVADLEAQNAQLTEEANRLSDDSAAALSAAVDGLTLTGDQLEVTAQQVTDALAALDAARTALEQAQGDLDTAVAERDQAAALLDNARLCAGGSADALSLISEGDVDGAVQVLGVVAPSCEAAFADAG